MVLFNVVVGFWIDGNGSFDLPFQGGYDVFLLPVENLSNLRVHLHSEHISHDVVGLA